MDTAIRLVLPLVGLALVLGACRADLGRRIAKRSPEGAATPSVTDRARAHWRSVAVHPTPRLDVEDRQTFDMARGADEDAYRALVDCVRMETPEPDRLARVGRFFVVGYCDPHCH